MESKKACDVSLYQKTRFRDAPNSKDSWDKRSSVARFLKKCKKKK